MKKETKKMIGKTITIVITSLIAILGGYYMIFTDEKVYGLLLLIWVNTVAMIEKDYNYYNVTVVTEEKK